MSLVHEPEEFIETSTVRVILRRASEMPFPDQPSRVASIVQVVGDRFLRWRQSGIRIFVVRSDRIELVTETRLVPTGQ